MKIALLCDELSKGPEGPEKEILVGALRPFYLAKELAKLNYDATLFSPYPVAESKGGVAYIPFAMASQAGSFDVAIARNWYQHERIIAKHHYVWMGDDGSCIFDERRWERFPSAKFVVESGYMVGRYKPFTCVHSVIPYGIREELYSVAPSFDKRWNLYTSCVWDPCRHIEAMIEAFRLVAGKFPEALLHMFGSSASWGRGRDAYTIAVEKAIGASGAADRVIVYGTISHNKMINALSSMGILLHLTSRETFGVAVREAMASGIPVCSNLCEGLNSVAYWPDCKQDPKLAACVIEGYLASEENYLEASRQGRNRADILTWPAVAKQWLYLLEADGCSK